MANANSAAFIANCCDKNHSGSANRKHKCTVAHRRIENARSRASKKVEVEDDDDDEVEEVKQPVTRGRSRSVYKPMIDEPVDNSVDMVYVNEFRRRAEPRPIQKIKKTIQATRRSKKGGKKTRKNQSKKLKY